MFNNTIQTLKAQGKAQPFGAHFTTKLAGVNSKLICALSTASTGCDDAPPTPDVPPLPVPEVEVGP